MVSFSLSVCQAAPAASFVPPEPLRIGVGGDFADGLDGMLAARGLPHERIFSWELGDPEALKRFDLLFLSCLLPLQPGADDALDAWVRAGGCAYVEVSKWHKGPYPLANHVLTVGPAPQPSDAVISDPAYVVASGLPAGTPIDLYDHAGMLLQPHEGINADVIARYCPDEGGDPTQDAAILTTALGQGELVYSGSALAFCCFRGEGTQPLLAAVIARMIRDRGRRRLIAALPETPESAPGTEAPKAPRAPAAGALPSGVEPVDTVAGGSYNVAATLGPVPPGGGPASILLLDGRATPTGKGLGRCLWLAFGATRIELRAGKTERATTVAAARWRLPTHPAELLVRRRTGIVSVVLGDEEVLRARTKAEPGGLVALKAGVVPLVDTYCQEVAEPVFFDNFMREADDPSEWATVSGQWTNVGVGHGEHSVNGFYLRGESEEMGLTTVGDWFWEDYAVSAAVRPEHATTCGLCALRQANGDLVAVVADPTARPRPTLRLLRVVDGRETVLAERAADLTPRQWHRLELRVREGKLEALVDGEVVVKCPNPEMRGGGVGLLVEGGAARFDDVLVQPAAEPLQLPCGEGTSTPDVPPYIGAEDRLGWANPAAPWVASAARPSLLWRQGDFPGDVSVSLGLKPETDSAFRRLILAPSDASDEGEWLSVTVRTTPGATTASLELSRPGAKPAMRQAALGSRQVLRLTRAANAVRVLWGQDVIYKARGDSALRRVGLEVDGPPIATGDIKLISAATRDYVFGAAPTDWRSSSGTWEVAARWACDARWSFFAGWGLNDVAVWHKHPLEGDVTVDYYVGVKMEAPGGSETERCRDLNTVLCGDMRNARSGYCFILGGEGGVKTQLLRDGVPVAESASFRVPPGFGVHAEWFHIRAARIGNRVELDLEGRPVFRWEDPDPLPGGHVGLWTHNNGILISRATIYH